MFVPLFRTAGVIPRSIVLLVVLVLELSSNDTFSPSTELYEQKLRGPVEVEDEKRLNLSETLGFDPDILPIIPILPIL